MAWRNLGAAAAAPAAAATTAGAATASAASATTARSVSATSGVAGRGAVACRASCPRLAAVAALAVGKPALGSTNIGKCVGLGAGDAREEASRAVTAKGVARNGVGVGKRVGEVGLRLTQGEIVVPRYAEGVDSPS